VGVWAWTIEEVDDASDTELPPAPTATGKGKAKNL
jgi:hypothetical protein